MDAGSLVWIQAVGAIAQSCIALATLLLSAMLWIISKQRARVEYTRSVQETWNNLNLAILSNTKLAPIADTIFGFGPTPESEELSQKRYLGFLCLNVLEAAYLGHTAGLVGKSYHGESIAHLLEPLLRDPDVVKLLRLGGYDSGFVAFCEKQSRGGTSPTPAKR